MASISLSKAQLIEGKVGETGKMRFEVRLSAAAVQDISIQYDTATNTSTKNPAAAGIDYTAAVAQTLTIAAGQTKGYIDIDILGDRLKEEDEIFDLILSNPLGAGFAKGNTLSTTGTILDDERRNIISIGAAKLIEGKAGDTGQMHFEVSLAAPAAQDVTIQYNTTANAKNSATPGADYTAAIAQTLTIAAGQTKGYIDIGILGDSLGEGDEVFDLTLSNPDGAGFAKGDTLSASGTILDDEPLVSIVATKLIEGKAGDTDQMRFEVNLSAPAAQDVIVQYDTTTNIKAKNPAAAGIDYTAAVAQTLTIAAGQTKGYINIDILGDGLKEEDEVFDLILSNPIGAGFPKGGTVAATGTILNDEPLISIAAAKLLEGKEGDTGQMRFEVSLSAPAAQDVSILYNTADNAKAKNPATAGADYTAVVAQYFTIAAGETKGYIDIDILGDHLKEADEAFDLILSNPDGAGFAKGATLSTTGTILDDEPLVSVAAAKLLEGKVGDTGQMRFEVSLSAPAAQDVTLQYDTATKIKNPATAGADYTTAVAQILTIAAGEAKGYIDIDILGDRTKEEDEFFDLILSNPVGAGFAKGTTLSATGTILDDERLSTISIGAAKLIEGKTGDTGKMRFEVSLAAASAQDVTVQYDTATKTKNPATAGVDYTAAIAQSLTIAAGETKGYIDIDILGDGTREGDEVFDLVLSNPDGGGFAKGDTLSATGTILDDEPLISIAAAKLLEGKVGETGQMRFEVSLSAPAAQDVTLQYDTATKTKNPATAGADYTAAVAQSITIAAGETKGHIDIDILGDRTKEEDEVFDLILSNPVGAGFAKGATLSATGTILDDERLCTISIGAAKLIEGKVGDTGQMRFEISLGAVSTQDVIVQYDTATNTKTKNPAVAGADYTAAIAQSLTIAAGQTKGYIDIAILGDRFKEADEIFDLILSNPDGGGFAKGDTLSATGTIVDDEPLISIAAAKLLEGKAGDIGKMRFEVSLSAVATQNVIIQYDTADNTKAKNPATAGTDYTAAVAQTLTIATGQTKGYIDIDILGDPLKEADEVFDLILSNPDGAGFAKEGTLSAAGTILDDEPLISIAAAKLLEGKVGDTGKMHFEISLSAPAAQDVTVLYNTAANTSAKNPATASTDYTAAVAQTLTITAGQTKGYIDIDILGDQFKEEDEVFDLILSNPLGADFAKGKTLSATGTILDDERRNTISIGAAKLIEGKAGDTGQMRFEVSLAAPAGQTVTVQYDTADNAKAKNSATAGSDYTAASAKTLTIAAGQTTGYIDVDILGDGLKEEDEFFNLTLSNPDGASFAKGATLSSTGTIVNDEPLISIAAAKFLEGKEGDTGKMRFEVSLSAIANQDITLQYDTAANVKAKNLAAVDIDYTAAVAQTLTIPAGQTKGYIEIEILGDRLKEEDEVFDLILSNPDGAGFTKGTTLSATGTILDDERLSTISIGTAKLIEGKAGDTGQMRFEVSLAAPATQDVTVQYDTATNANAKNPALAGTDYTAVIAQSLTIAAGETKGYIDIDILGDGIGEGNEVFDLILSNPDGAGFAKGVTLSATGTILDDEPLVSIAAAKLLEGKAGDTGKMRFEVSLSAPAAQDVTLQYDTATKTKNPATADVDYTAVVAQTLTIATGETKGYIDIDILGDRAKEEDEVFDLILSNPVGAGFAKGATLSATGTILDDERLSILSISAAKFIEGKAGDTGQMRFEVSLAAPTTQDVIVQYDTATNASTKNPATAGVDYTAVVAQTLTIAAGETKGHIDIDILGDGVREGDEVFDLILSNPDGGGFAKGATLSATGTIVSDEPLISIAAAKLLEGKAGDTGKMRFVVNLSAIAAQDVIIQYNTADNTQTKNPATAGTDYTAAVAQTLTIATGETKGYIDIDILGDRLKEADEVFDLILSNPDGAGFAKGSQITVVGTIIDDEPIISFP